MIVELDPLEAAVAYQVAAMRHNLTIAAGGNGTRSRRDKGALGARVNHHIVGFMAELAYAKWKGVYPDLCARAWGTATPEFVAPNGATVDVKGTPKADGNLVVNRNPHHGNNADIYVLAIVEAVGDLHVVEFVGWAAHDDIIREDRLNSRLPVPAYFMARSELTPFTERATA